MVSWEAPGDTSRTLYSLPAGPAGTSSEFGIMRPSLAEICLRLVKKPQI